MVTADCISHASNIPKLIYTCHKNAVILHILDLETHSTYAELSVPCGTHVCMWEEIRLCRLRILFSL